MPLQLFGTLIKWKVKAICSQGKSKIPGPSYIQIHNCGQVTQDSCSLALCIPFDECLLPLYLTHETDLAHACLRLQLATVLFKQVVQFSSVQFSHSVMSNSLLPHESQHTSLSITNPQSSPKLLSIKLVMPSSHLILCHPLLLLPPIPPNIRVFSNESTKYWEFQLQHQSFHYYH